MASLVKPYVKKFIPSCFTCIAKDFQEEKGRLEVERTTFKQRLNDAKRKGEDVQGDPLSWDEEAENLIQEDTKTRGKELSIGLPAGPSDVEHYSSQDYIPFKSREYKYKELLDALIDDNNFIVGLQGIGGTGKTTLVKEVGKELKRSNQFTRVIDTTMSFSPDIRKIQDDIAGPLGLKFDDCNKSDRSKKLWSRLTNGEKILIILDDVWGDMDFYGIGIPERDNHKGCRILVTTRSRMVCNKLGCSKTIQLDLLSEEDAWIMFQRYAGLSEISTTSLLNKGRKIAQECKRLPIAIAAIASSLKGEHRQEKWDVTLNSLQKHMSYPGFGDMVRVYTCLKCSIDNIKEEKAKTLFFLCSLFQENEEISIEVLTRLCIGMGLFGEDYGSYHDSRKQVVVAKNKLLDSCLLLEVSKKEVKMHDLVRDAAHWIANKEIQSLNLSDKNQKSFVERETNIKYLFCEGKDMDLFSCKLDGSKLETLIVCMNGGEEDCECMEVPNSFFENFVILRVLYFECKEMRPLSLPQSIQSLKNIRSLLFTCVDLGDISILGNLPSLETLDLKDCKIDELPHEIANLKKFRLLNMEGCEIERNNPFEVIKECSSLEELYFTGSFNAFCQEITFPKLQRFCIDEYLRLGNDSFSKYVSVVDKEEVFLSETTLEYCMQTAEVLRIRTIEWGLRNHRPKTVSMDHCMEDMVELSLSCFSQLQYLIDNNPTYFHVPTVLSNLVVLELDRMENLEELFNGPISLDSLKNLEKLSIKDCKHLQSLFKCQLNLCNLKTIKLQNCPMLVSLFQPVTYLSLVLLDKLQISNCEGLESIISDERREEESREESHDSMLQKLKVLDIEGCPRLTYILPFLSAQGLPVLESIRITRCDGLKYIIDQDHFISLDSLKNLEKLLIMDCEHLGSAVFRCKLNLCNLKTIILQNCPMLVSLFQLLTYRSLVLLEILQIYNCEGLENIASDERREEESREEIAYDDDDESCASMLQKLKVLDIEGCPRLRFILPLLSAQGLPVLEAIRIRRCVELKNIFDEDHSMIYHLYIWERVQCVSILQSHSMCNIKEIHLSHFLKIKSVFMLSITPRLLVETLTITNCNELKSIIVDTVDQDSSGNSWGDVFPRLKRINVGDCIQLEYIFGQSSLDDRQSNNKVHLRLPTLENINLCNLPGLVAMSTKQYRTTFPPSAELEHNGCSQVAIKSFHGFVTRPISKKSQELNYIEISVEEGSTSTNPQTIQSSAHFEFPSSLIAPENKSTSHDYGNGQIGIEDANVDGSHETSQINNQGHSKGFPEGTEVQETSGHELTSSHENGILSNKYEIVETEINATTEGKQEFVVNNIPALVIPEVENSQVIVERKMKQTAEANQEFVVNVSGLQIVEVANSQELLNEQPTSQLEEIDTAVKPSQSTKAITSPTYSDQNISSSGPLVIYDHKTSSPLEGSTSEKTAAAAETMSTISKTKNEADIQLYAPKQKGISSTLVPNAKTISSSTHSKSVTSLSGPSATSECETSSQEYGDVKNRQETSKTNDDQGDPSQIDEKFEDGDDKIAMTSFSVATTETNDQVSQNDDAFKKESSNIVEKFYKDDTIIVSESTVASQFPTVPYIGDPSQKEDLSSSLLVKTELEQLVSKKHLDYENLSLLTDFLVKHPSIRLKDTSLRDRYKGPAYNLLAELLKFLETHSVLDVLGSYNSEFVDLLQDAHNFGFDKDWLDDIKRRTLFLDIQVSQDALQNLLVSKQQITKDVEMLCLKIEDLKHQLTSSKDALKNIIQQEAALSAPIGY